MSDKFRIDSHKLLFHPKRVNEWQEAYGDWEKEKFIYPIYVEVSPYGGCNHRCTFCGVDYMGYKSIKIDVGVYAKTIADMGRLGVKSVMFAGEGEPFLHKDLPQMVALSKDSGVDVGITTNFVMANEKSDVYGCSCYLGQEKFAFGNINNESFESIWQGDRRAENAKFIREKLNISQCRVNCRMDSVNRYLWELTHPNGHINFI